MGQINDQLAKYGLMVTDGDKAQAAWRGLMNASSQLMAAGATTTDPGHFAKTIAGVGPAFTNTYDAGIDQARNRGFNKFKMSEMTKGAEDADIARDASALKTTRHAEAMKFLGEKYKGLPYALRQDAYEGDEKYRRDAALAGIKASSPKGRAAAPIQNFAERQRLVAEKGANSPEVKRFDSYVRASKWVDTGSGFSKLSPVTPATPEAVVPKSLAPSQTVEHQGAVAFEKAEQGALGKEHGEAGAKLSVMEAAMPRLDAAVAKLSALGKTATYTKAGQAANVLRRETGQDVGLGAVARAAYVAHVAANILPLLKSTFGAQFTVAEGESLKATLGDPNMSPEEKDAVLEAFIENKKAEVLSLRRQTQGQGDMPQSAIDDGVTPAMWGKMDKSAKDLYP